MDANSKKILFQYTQDALSILTHSLRLVKEGEPSFYRVAAVQLRILLCDTTFRHDRQEEISVLPILFPELCFHPLDSSGKPDEHIGPIPLQQWLELPAYKDSPLTLRQMIRRICDVDGGAHVEVKPLAGVPEGVDACIWISGIAEEIIPVLAEKLKKLD